MSKKKTLASAKSMYFFWFVLFCLAGGGIIGSIKGGMSELLQGGFYSRWWIGAIVFFVCLVFVRKSAGRLKKRIYEAGSIDNRDLANGGVRNE